MFIPYFEYCERSSCEHSWTSFCVDTLSFSWVDRHLGETLLGHMVPPGLTFWRTANCFTKMTALFYIPLTMREGSNFSPSFLVIICLLDYRHSRGYLTVVLICISLIGKDVEHLFIAFIGYLYMLFWRVFKPFVHF